jgi:hypothetical protein
MNSLLAWIGLPNQHFEYYVTALAALFAFSALASSSREWPDKRFEPLLFLAMAFVLFAWRWPIFLAPFALNPDEGSLTAYALKATVDFVPWRGFDAGTSGPLNSYILALPALAALPITFVSARITATALMLLTVISFYYAMKWLHGPRIARLSTIPPILLLSLTIDFDFVHYSSEHFPICLTTIALAATAYIFKGTGVRRSLMLAGGVAGLCIGASLFAKLQVGPIAGTIFALAGLAIWSLPRQESNRRATALSMLAGLAVVPGTIGASLFWTGGINDAFFSYIGEAMRYVGEGKAGLGPEFFFSSSAMYTVFLVGSLVVLFLGALLGLRFRTLSVRSIWTLVGSIVLLLAAFLAITRPQRAFPHYLLFSIIPIGCCVSSILSLVSQANNWVRSSPVFSTAYALLFLAPSLAVAIGTSNPFLSQVEYNLTHRKSDVAIAISRYLKPGDTMALWGWAGEYFVQTGAIMATRDVDAVNISYPHPNREYRRRRFMSDLEKSRPPLFVDAVSPGAFGLKDRASQGHESFPALASYIRQNYHIADHLYGVRIYTRKPGDGSAANKGSFRFDATAGPGMATFDNASDQPVTFHFSATGTWTCASGGPQVGPAGSDARAPDTFYLPGANTFALIAKRGDASFQYIGETAKLTLNPREVISFLMNDSVGATGDNSGSLQISWAKE